MADHERHDEEPAREGSGAEETLHALVQAVEQGVDELSFTPDGHEYVYVRRDGTHRERELKHRLKLAHKHIGKQGDTIHLLRSELAEARSLSSRLERGELRRRDAQLHLQDKVIQDLETTVKVLEEKLQAKTLEELEEGTE